MTSRVPTLVSWSGGKDSAVALSELQRSPEHQVIGLLTTIGSESRRVAFHNVHRDLVRAQARALGLPLHEVSIPAQASNVEYEAAMRSAVGELKGPDGLTIAYGDLFLEDIRNYRVELAARIGVTSIFPVWRRDTRNFVRDFIAAGFDAIVVSIDLARLDGSLAGRRLTEAFLADLPPEVDQCGENGEFHTFVIDGPSFFQPVPVRIGALAERDRHCYCELSLSR